MVFLGPEVRARVAGAVRSVVDTCAASRGRRPVLLAAIDDAGLTLDPALAREIDRVEEMEKL
jgi:hypothetical protein